MPPTTAVSGVPRTFGILSIIFAGIVLLFSLFGVISLLVPLLIAHAPPPARAEDAANIAAISHAYTAMGGVSALLSVMSAALIALGIGQLRYRAWAAVWSVRWAVVALGVVIVMADLMATTFTRSIFELASRGSPSPPAMHQLGNVLGLVYAAMTVFFYAPYPIVLLIFFSRPRVRAAMTA
jgi:hypothetical protein